MSQTPPPPPSATSAASGTVGKIRSPWAPILLGIITLGIYTLVYEFKTFDEMKKYSGEGIGGGLALVLAFICGIVDAFLLPSEVGNLYQRDSKPAPVSAMTAFWLFLPLLGIFIYYFKVQGALNDFWTSKGATKS
jgi:hypothetical protein